MTQESNLGLLHCRQMIYQLSYEGSPEGGMDRWRKGWVDRYGWVDEEVEGWMDGKRDG